jgi:hypothetical protein
MLEALACGTPVATFPHAVMQDVVGGCQAAALDTDLAAACRRALTLSRSEARAFALTRSCRASTLQFLGNLVVEQPQEA